MNNQKTVLFCIILLISFAALTTAAFIAKPEINKSVIFRLMK